MAKTGGHLKVKQMGTNSMGVELEGNPEKPEPLHFRVRFPGGDVDIARCDDGKNWVHVRVNNPRHSSFDPTEETARIELARADYADRGVETPIDVTPDLYHLAVLVDHVAPEDDLGEYEISRSRCDTRCSEDDCHVPATRRRPTGELTCGNHDGDRNEAQVRVEDCTMMISGSTVWVNSPTGCVLRLQFGTRFEMGRAAEPGPIPMIDMRADSGQGVFTPARP